MEMADVAEAPGTLAYLHGAYFTPYPLLERH